MGLLLDFSSAFASGDEAPIKLLDYLIGDARDVDDRLSLRM
jgi:hypothetical protein